MSSAFAGSFDITSAGTSTQLFNDRGTPGVSADSILSQVTAAANNAVEYKALLATLGREG